MLEELPEDHYGKFARHCNTCGEFRQPLEFHIFKHVKMLCGFQVYNSCIECEQKRKWECHLKNAYGLSVEKYNSMSEEQDHKCFICGSIPSGKSKKLVVDHCHKTGEIRKLLCITCNVQLSKFESNPDFVQKIIQYLNLPYERKK
jgi:hypothetical protein